MTGSAPSRPAEGNADTLAMEELGESVADLHALVRQLQTIIDGQGRTIAELAAQYATLEETGPPGPVGDGATVAVPDPRDEDGDRPKAEQDDGEAEEKAPTFILYLPDDGGAASLWRQELEALAAWVEGILVPYYLGEANPNRPWCARWFEHGEGVARLHACWMAWQELTDPAAGGHTGPSVWHRDHLADALQHLMHPEGPFSGCSADPAHPSHDLPRTVLVTSCDNDDGIDDEREDS